MTKKTNRVQKKNIDRIFMFTGIILIVISLIFMYFVNLNAFKRKVKIAKLERKFKQEIIMHNENNVNQEDIENVNTAEEVDNDNDSLSDDEIWNAFEDAIVGFLRINKINVVLPIFNDTSKKSLLAGVGILEESDLISGEKNKMTVLAGHRGGQNGDQSFLNIDKLEKDDEIKITTKKQIFYYKVIGQEIIEPTDWNKFIREEGKTKLYLISCHPYPQNYQRIIVESELITQENEKLADKNNEVR